MLTKLAGTYGQLIKRAEEDTEDVEDERGFLSTPKSQLGMLLVGGGAQGAYKQRGKLDGVERLFHGTDTIGSRGIRETGIEASRAGRGGASRMIGLEGVIGSENVAGKTYTTTSKNLATDIARKQVSYRNFENAFLDQNNPTSRRVLEKVRIPLRDFQTRAVNEVPNPELRGLSKKEYAQMLTKEHLGTRYDKAPKPFKKGYEKLYGVAYKGLDSPTTRTVQGDIAPKYIKKSPHYQGGQTLKGFADYVKHNPKRFASGAGLAGLGGASVALGGKLLKDEYDEKKE